MKKLFVIYILFCLSFYTVAQNSTELEYFDKEHFNNKIVISQSIELKNYLNSYVKYNKKRNGFDGYRIKIYSQNTGNARAKANSIRIAFEQLNNGQKAYITFNSPNFEVHVGDFTNKFEAMNFLNTISSSYPEAYIIDAIIQFPNRNTLHKTDKKQ